MCFDQIRLTIILEPTAGIANITSSLKVKENMVTWSVYPNPTRDNDNPL